MRHRESLTIDLSLDRAAVRPLPEQLANQLCAAIDAGTLARHTRMPSTRTLGLLLDVSRGVTVAAYDLLFSRGYVEGRTGSGTYVAARPVTVAPAATPTADESFPALVDLTPGQPCAEGFPLAAWRAAWRGASYLAPPLGALPALGLPALRAAIGVHLARTGRAVPAGHDILVTAGAADGLRTVLAALGRRGAVVAVEDPAPYALRQAAGGDCLPLPVDAHGARFDGITSGCSAVVLSADAQVPLGHALSADRRRQVLDWSRQTGGHVLELACDAVPRLATAHLPRLLTADTRARIVLIGDLGEVVTPTLKVGYAVVPRDLAQSLRAAPEQPSYLTQLAVTHLITQGALHRRMKRLAGLLDRKLPLVRAALGALHGRAELFGLDAVGTVGLRLIGGLDAEQVGADLARSGLVVPTMAGYRNRARPDETELLLGYPHLTDPALRHGLSRLAAALTRL